MGVQEEKLRELLEEYALRSGRPELRDCTTLKEFRKLFPIQDKIPGVLLPQEGEKFFLFSDS